MLTHLDSAFHTDPQPLIDDAKKHFNGPINAARDICQITVSSP